jgi:hypothetical protein
MGSSSRFHNRKFLDQPCNFLLLKVYLESSLVDGLINLCG